MAITAGVRAMLGWRSGIIRSAMAAVDARRTQADESGTHTSGAGPDLVSQSPLAPRVCAISAESLPSTSTVAHLPCTAGLVFCQLRTSPSRTGCRLGEVTTVALTWPEQEPRTT